MNRKRFLVQELHIHRQFRKSDLCKRLGGNEKRAAFNPVLAKTAVMVRTVKFLSRKRFCRIVRIGDLHIGSAQIFHDRQVFTKSVYAFHKQHLGLTPLHVVQSGKLGHSLRKPRFFFASRISLLFGGREKLGGRTRNKQGFPQNRRRGNISPFLERLKTHIHRGAIHSGFARNLLCARRPKFTRGEIHGGLFFRKADFDKNVGKVIHNGFGVKRVSGERTPRKISHVSFALRSQEKSFKRPRADSRIFSRRIASSANRFHTIAISSGALGET